MFKINPIVRDDQHEWLEAEKKRTGDSYGRTVIEAIDLLRKKRERKGR